MDVLIDAGLGYGADAKRAIWVAREFEQLGVYWLEEPFEPDELEAYAELADTVDLRIAAGEHDATSWGFRELIDGGHLDVVQPDMTRCGGLTEALRIARLAADRGVVCMPHAWKSGIVKAASLHLNAVLPGDAAPGVLRRRHPDQRGADDPEAPVEGWLRGRADGARPGRRPRPGDRHAVHRQLQQVERRGTLRPLSDAGERGSHTQCSPSPAQGPGWGVLQALLEPVVGVRLVVERAPPRW